jgi:ribosomal protein L11 methyltransferase
LVYLQGKIRRYPETIKLFFSSDLNANHGSVRSVDYIKVTIEIEPYEQWIVDSLSYHLSSLGYESFMETLSGVEAYIPEKDFRGQSLEALFSELPDSLTVSWYHEQIKERNWNEEWEQNEFKPVVIKNQCLIRAPYHSGHRSFRYEILLDPNMSFGTGSHETTRMMIEFLLDEDLTGLEVLDMGCGTGILSIFASMRGAASVTAIDTQERACQTTALNAKRNHIHNIRILEGDASLLAGRHFDLILANIHRNVLLADMKKYVSALQPEGKLALSGFYIPDLPLIREKTESLGLTDIESYEKNNWILYTCQKTS